MRILYLLFFFLLLWPISTTATSSLEEQVAQTIGIVEETRNSGAYVDDLVDRLNSVVQSLDECGWEDCSATVVSSIQLELQEIQLEAQNRRKSINYLLPVLVFFLIIIIILERYFSLSHKIKWYLMKNKKIFYLKEE